jgi:arginyl-tRNA--protein-N-Asp/Glu arginylyltransferase
MIKINYEHFYGSQERYDIQLVKMKLDQSVLSSETEALENGWLIHNNEWYASRSVRIKLDEYKMRHELPNTITYQFTTYDLEPIKKIYAEYKAYKKFDEDFDIFSDSERAVWLIVKDDEVPVAFTKFIRYNDGIESQFTCWNYHNPKLSIGKNIVDMEVWYTSALQLDYLYIGQGYEKGSIYKSQYPGFQWWTGTEWSTNKARYKELCSRDSNINTIQDLSKTYSDA